MLSIGEAGENRSRPDLSCAQRVGALSPTLHFLPRESKDYKPGKNLSKFILNVQSKYGMLLHKVIVRTSYFKSCNHRKCSKDGAHMREKTVRDVRREEIIAAARDLFSRKGYHGTSVPDIARAAGISTGLIYYIFPNKENILLACCEMAAVIHLDLFNQTTDIADPLQRFDYIVRELYKSLDRGSKWVIIIYRDSSILTRETRQQVMALIKHVDNRFLELFEEGQRTGYFARDIPKLPLLASNVLNLGHMWAL